MTEWLVLPVLLLLTFFAGCAANTENTVPNALVIPIKQVGHDGPESAVRAYYATVLSQMRDSLADGTADGLREFQYLLRQHKRDDMVEFARVQIERYELLADGLRFELSLPQHCRIRVASEQPSIAHVPHKCEFVLAAEPDWNELRFGGVGEQSAGFQVIVRVRDFDATGQFVESKHVVPLWVSERQTISKAHDLVLPFTVPAAPARVVARELAVVVHLLPCVLSLDGRDLPAGQIGTRRLSPAKVAKLPARERLDRGDSGYATCCDYRAILYPEGVKSIREAPLKTLSVALRRGEAKLFRHVFLAAHFMPEKDREQAMQLLIGRLRLGTAAQAQVAMGALRVVTRKDLPITDRRTWLRWWQGRQAALGRSTAPKKPGKPK